MSRWDEFSDDDLRDIDRAFGVDDQEYGYDSPLWAEIRGELLRRAYPDPVERVRMIDWDAAISEDHHRFPSPFERMLRDSYAPAMLHYAASPVWPVRR